MNNYTDCCLCPRNCHVDRTQGKNRLLWTDRSDTRGTGCITYVGGTLHIRRCGIRSRVFSGCTLGCVFCQNQSIAAGSVGKTISAERLAEIFLELQEQKAWNINLVTAGHFCTTGGKSAGIGKTGAASSIGLYQYIRL